MLRPGNRGSETRRLGVPLRPMQAFFEEAVLARVAPGGVGAGCVGCGGGGWWAEGAGEKADSETGGPGEEP